MHTISINIILVFHSNYNFALEARVWHKIVTALQLLTLLKRSFTVLKKNIVFINHRLGKLLYDLIRFIFLLPNENVSYFISETNWLLTKAVVVVRFQSRLSAMYIICGQTTSGTVVACDPTHGNNAFPLYLSYGARNYSGQVHNDLVY